MQDACVRARKLAGADAVAAQAEHIACNAVGKVDTPDLLIRGILQRKDAFAAQKLHDEPVEVLCTGADDDLRGSDVDAAAARKICGYGFSQLGAAVVGRLDEDAFAVFAQHAAHGFGKDGKGKIVGKIARGGQLAHAVRLGDGEAVGGGIGDKVAAALARLKIALVTQNGVGVLHRNDAHAGLLGKQPLAGQLFSVGVYAADNVPAQLVIELQIGALRRVLFNAVFHLVISKAPLLTVSSYQTEYSTKREIRKEGNPYRAKNRKTAHEAS